MYFICGVYGIRDILSVLCDGVWMYYRVYVCVSVGG